MKAKVKMNLVLIASAAALVGAASSANAAADYKTFPALKLPFIESKVVEIQGAVEGDYCRMEVPATQTGALPDTVGAYVFRAFDPGACMAKVETGFIRSSNRAAITDVAVPPSTTTPLLTMPVHVATKSTGTSKELEVSGLLDISQSELEAAPTTQVAKATTCGWIVDVENDRQSLAHEVTKVGAATINKEVSAVEESLHFEWDGYCWAGINDPFASASGSVTAKQETETALGWFPGFEVAMLDSAVGCAGQIGGGLMAYWIGAAGHGQRVPNPVLYGCPARDMDVLHLPVVGVYKGPAGAPVVLTKDYIYLFRVSSCLKNVPMGVDPVTTRQITGRCVAS